MLGLATRQLSKAKVRKVFLFFSVFLALFFPRHTVWPGVWLSQVAHSSYFDFAWSNFRIRSSRRNTFIIWLSTEVDVCTTAWVTDLWQKYQDLTFSRLHADWKLKQMSVMVSMVSGWWIYIDGERVNFIPREQVWVARGEGATIPPLIQEMQNLSNTSKFAGCRLIYLTWSRSSETQHASM